MWPSGIIVTAAPVSISMSTIWPFIDTFRIALSSKQKIIIFFDVDVFFFDYFLLLGKLLFGPACFFDVPVLFTFVTCRIFESTMLRFMSPFSTSVAALGRVSIFPSSCFAPGLHHWLCCLPPLTKNLWLMAVSQACVSVKVFFKKLAFDLLAY